jgi:acetyltransferase-like isoleucine patch superfamily enzyme
MYSLTVREMYRRYHDLDVGLYTIGPCETGPENFAPGTTIGRYCSIYYTVRTIGPNDDGFAALRHVGRMAGAPSECPTRNCLAIGNDVFIGHNAIILPSVTQIGDGAYIGAGAVVQNPVPPYAIVMGNPGRVVKYRFSEKVIAELRESRWWEKPLGDLAADWESFQVPLDGTACHR